MTISSRSEQSIGSKLGCSIKQQFGESTLWCLSPQSKETPGQLVWMPTAYRR